MINRIYANWVYGGFLAGILLIFCMPLFTSDWSFVLKLCYLTLPVYMVHQLEEWDNDKFRVFINNHLGNGVNLLTPCAGFFINVFGVWGVIAASLYLATSIDAGYVLIAAYLVLINALVHIVAGLVLRAYNPGLVTAIILFLPLGTYLILISLQMGHGSVHFQLIGLLTAIFIHAAIVLHLARRRISMRGK